MINDYLNQTVNYARFAGKNAYGEPSYNADVSIAARVSYRQKKVYNRIGEEATSFCHLTVEEEVSYDDRFTLADGEIRTPLSIRHARNADGTLHHSEVDL